MEQAELEKLIGELEIAVDRLRSLYEQYFMGIEKLEPTVPRKDVDRRVYVLRKEQIRNTALRFRFHMLLQRYNTYQTHWQRVCRDIENGTYKRHVIRAQQRFAAQPARSEPPASAPKSTRAFAEELAELDREFAPAETLHDADVELEEEASPASHATAMRPGSGPSTPRTAQARPPRTPPPRPVRPAPPRSSPRPPRPDSRPAPPSSSRPPPSSSRPAPSSSRPASPRPAAPPPARRPAVAVRPVSPTSGPLPGNDPPDERLRQLYSQYLDAKRRQNESTSTITYEAVARSIRASSAKLRQKLGKPVDFEIAVKDGHAIIRPKVK